MNARMEIISAAQKWVDRAEDAAMAEESTQVTMAEWSRYQQLRDEAEEEFFRTLDRHNIEN